MAWLMGHWPLDYRPCSLEVARKPLAALPGFDTTGKNLDRPFPGLPALLRAWRAHP